jgi:hypothetical protein
VGPAADFQLHGAVIHRESALAYQRALKQRLNPLDRSNTEKVVPLLRFGQPVLA